MIHQHKIDASSFDASQRNSELKSGRIYFVESKGGDTKLVIGSAKIPWRETWILAAAEMSDEEFFQYLYTILSDLSQEDSAIVNVRFNYSIIRRASEEFLEVDGEQ